MERSEKEFGVPQFWPVSISASVIWAAIIPGKAVILSLMLERKQKKGKHKGELIRSIARHNKKLDCYKTGFVANNFCSP